MVRSQRILRMPGTWSIFYLAAVLIGPTVADWPQWRGPKRDGHAVGFQSPEAWPEELNQAWQIEVGLGHSAPIVVQRRVYQFSREGTNEVLRILDLETGKQQFIDQYPALYEVNPAAAAHGPGPKSTPVYGAGHVYTLGISGILSAWNGQTGSFVWRREFSKEFPATAPLYGTATSPIIYGNNVIAHVGGHDQGALRAFDGKTGETIWSWGEDGPAYTSPIVAEIGGTRQLITQTQKYCVSLDPNDGKELWRIPFTTEYDQSSVTPVLHADMIIFSGFQRGVFAVLPEKSDQGWQAKTVWENKDISLYMNSPVVSGKYLFGLAQDKKGTYFCLDPKTGKVRWTSKGRQGENSSIVESGGVLLSLTTSGTLHVLQANPTRFQQVASIELSNTPVWAHLVVSGDRVLVKDEKNLTAWSITQSP